MSDHERIWLQNAEDAKHTLEGRLWCQDKVWPDAPEDGEPTEYVRADLVATARAEARREAFKEAAAQAENYDRDPGDDTYMGPIKSAQVRVARVIAADIRALMEKEGGK